MHDHSHAGHENLKPRVASRRQFSLAQQGIGVRVAIALALVVLIWAAIAAAGGVMARQAAAIRLNDLTLGYDGHPAVHHLDGTFADGSLTAIVGPNGSGKSTLLKGITGILKPLGGSIERSGTRPRNIAYLPQSAEIDRSFPATVADLVALGHWAKRGLFGAITGTGLSRRSSGAGGGGARGFEHRPLDTLSGGQAQRALFARVMLQDADVILLDEPFTAIDEKNDQPT